MKRALFILFAFHLFLTNFACAQQTELLEWAKALGGSVVGYSIAVDASGNVFTTGFFTGTVDFDPGATTFNLTPVSSRDIFVSKLDASGNFVWARAMGGTGAAGTGFSIATDASGNVFTTGEFVGTFDFDPSAATFTLTSTSPGSVDVFVSKLDPAGNFVWARAMGGSNPDRGESIATDASGNVFTTGYFSGPAAADFDPGPATFNLTSAGSVDIFVSKLDAAGNFVWAKALRGPSLEVGNSIATDASGNVFTTGYFRGTTDFDPGAATFNLIPAGSEDIFISKLDASGNFVWARAMGGTGSDVGRSIATDPSGNVLTTGLFNLTADFDPGAATFTLTASAGLQRIFVSKLDASGNFVWAGALGGANGDTGESIATDASGNVFTTGTFIGATDFDPGASIFTLSSTAGSSDIFISKLDASGNFVWAGAMGGSSGGDVGESITTDVSGNVDRKSVV